MATFLAEHRFRAMNTDVGAWLWAEPGPSDIWLPELEVFFCEVEAELSRFRPDSGLSQLNACAGQGPQKVSSMLAEVLALALEARAQSGGIFDPTMLPALVAAGYDRSFELLDRRTEQGMPEAPAMRGHASERHESGNGIELNRPHRTISLPEGVQLDLGGIAKGWTVDRAAAMLGVWGPALVDAGGDIRATAAPGGEPWPVAVQDPFHPEEDLAVVRLSNGAIATSSIMRRNWAVGGQKMHHLIDPRTGRPSETELVSVSVLAATTVRAEVVAKVALILGHYQGRAFIEHAGLDALLVNQDGRIETVGREEVWH